jgi:hypothetical protein
MVSTSRGINQSFFLVLLALVSLLYLNSYVTATDCTEEQLPRSFDGPAFLGDDGHFHFSGTYQLNFTNGVQNVSFWIDQPSFGRFAVIQDDLRLRITLYALGPDRFMSSSWASPEALISAPFSEGQYRISFTPTEALLPCHTVILEADITPVVDIQQHNSGYTCPGVDNLPETTILGNLDSTGYSLVYDTLNDPTHDPSWFALRNPLPQEHGLRFARGWNFELKKPAGKSGLFSFKALLGYDFLTSGSLGLVLVPGNTTTPAYDCTACNWGSKTVQNHNVLEQVLSPGKYTLWIYDIVDQKNTTISGCSPYQLRVDLTPLTSVENSLSCTAPRVPKTLNDPGYISEEGYLQYSENPYIDIAGGSDMGIPFNVTKPSLFRAYLYNPHADLDLELYNSTNGRIASSFRSVQYPDVIIYQLLPGSYKLVVGIFGAWPDSFCDTFLLEIGIIPADTFDSSYCPQASSKPDFTGFQQAIKDSPFSWTLSTPDSPYYYIYNPSDHYTQKTIFVQNFTTDDFLAVHAMLGFNFVLNDMTAWIVDYENKVNFFATPVHDYNVVHLIANIPPGTYGLVVTTGLTQYTTTDTTWFPPCLEYTMSFSVKALPDKPRCWDFPSVPASLNTPQYLGNIDRVHLVGNFLLPTFTFTAEQSIYFTVGKPSEFRAFTAPGAVDCDFILYEDNADVNRSMSVRGSDQIVYVLSVGKSYRLKIRYYNWGSKTLPPCSTFELELAIAPLPDQFWVTCAPLSPDGKVVTVATDSPLEKHSVYEFNQADTPFTARVQFVSSGPFEFRALATYPFLRGDLALTLSNNATGQGVTHGSSGNNWENLGPLTLGAGTYDLRIAEPIRLPGDLRRCVQFALSYWVAPATLDTDDDSLLVQCGKVDLPSSFNSAAYLSPISGQSFNLVNDFLVNTAGHSSSVSFSLDQTSIFRAYLPATQVIDVDIRLRSGDANGPTIASSLGLYTAEQILAELPGPADYTLSITYYSFNSPYPTKGDCASFPIELSIEPVTQVTGNPVFTASCTDSNQIFPSILDSQPYPPAGVLVHRSTNTNQSFHYHINFSVEDYAQFYFNLQYDFITSGLTLRLAGQVEGSEEQGEMYWPAQIGVNHAWLNLNLGAGNYTVHVTNGTGFDSVKSLPYVQCQYWSWYYSLNFTDDLPDDECSDFNTLPTDLYSRSGGNQAFGGPQDSTTGDVVISGQFYLPNTQSRTRFIMPQKGYLRPLSVQQATFTVIQDTQGSLPINPAPDGFYSLSPGSYYLGITMTGASTSDCPTLDLVVVIESNDTVTSELMCPVQMPSPLAPPNNITVTPTTFIYSDNYIFSYVNLDYRTGRVYLYNMTLYVQQAVTLNAKIDFDVLVVGFGLTLFDKNNLQIATGSYGPIENQNDQVFNYESSLQATLQPGTYMLQISDSVKPAFSQFVNYCHQFAFTLSALRTASTPILLSVSPPGATKLNPRKDLSLQLIFSERVYRPMKSNIQAAVRNQQLVYLQNLHNSSDKIIPYFVKLIPESFSILRVVFNHSSFALNGADYQLIVSVPNFIADNSTAFTDPNGAAQNVIFSFSGCNCNGRGTCNMTSESCICNPGYTGPNCLSCADGYHAAADVCVPNAVCDSDTCNNHGKCVQSAGSVSCICSAGYGNTATEFCNTCAPGYSGYPSCKEDSDDEEARCNLALLPASLDQPAYLGTTGRIHLQGYYFIDLFHRHHETTFTLYQDSLIRVFTPPHVVDIDITLYSLNTVTESLTRITSSLSFNDAESVYTTLKANSENQQYQLQFRYFVWGGVKVADCQSFNLDLEIVPKSVAQSEITIFNSDKCQVNLLPLQENEYQSQSRYSISMENGLAYTPSTTFAVMADQPSWLLRWDFSIGTIPADNVVTFQAGLEERFLTGALAIVLEYGNNHTHCGIGTTTRQSRAACVVGRDVMNGHILATQLGPGNYTLWLYQPSAQDSSVSACSPFTFNLNISLSQADEDVFNCPYAEIPTSLDYNLYHKRPLAPGRLHLADEYLLHDEGDKMAFSLRYRSQIRIALYSSSFVFATITPANKTTTITGAVSYDDKITLSAVLDPGNYTINFQLIKWGTDTFCPTARMELAVIPDASVPLICTTSVEALPSLTGPITVPYAFNVLTNYPFYIPQYNAFYTATRAQNSGLITSYNFTLSDAAHLTTEIDFIFYYDDFTLTLDNIDAGTTTMGVNRYNNNFLSIDLEAGNYTLTIWFEDGSNPPLARPRKCAQFNFMFALDPLGSSVSEKCNQIGEEVPLTLDTNRFLGWGRAFDYQSDIWRIPNPEALMSLTGTYFTISQQSVFRVFVDKNAHDIDLILYQVNTSDASMTYLSRSTSALDEEEIYIILSPGYYHLRFRFYNWANLKGCAYFNMEWSVQPITPLTKLCPNSGSDLWPPSPPAVLGRDGYSYDSDNTGDYLYLQQVVDQTKSKVYTFKITQTSDLFAELDFDFTSGSLAISLKQINGTKYYGQRIRDGSVLVQSGLSAGDYQLTIYEETKDLPDILGCSYFSFRLLVRDSNSGNLIAEEIQYPPFPQTLDTIGQLQFNEMMHLESDTCSSRSSPSSETSNSLLCMILLSALLLLVCQTTTPSKSRSPAMVERPFLLKQTTLFCNLLLLEAMSFPSNTSITSSLKLSLPMSRLRSNLSLLFKLKSKRELVLQLVERVSSLKSYLTTKELTCSLTPPSHILKAPLLLSVRLRSLDSHSRPIVLFMLSLVTAIFLTNSPSRSPTYGATWKSLLRTTLISKRSTPSFHLGSTTFASLFQLCGKELLVLTIVPTSLSLFRSERFRTSLPTVPLLTTFLSI